MKRCGLFYCAVVTATIGAMSENKESGVFFPPSLKTSRDDLFADVEKIECKLCQNTQEKSEKRSGEQSRNLENPRETNAMFALHEIMKIWDE